MTKISSFCSRSGSRVFFAAVVLTLKPFGAVPELVAKDNPWHGFNADGPVLTIVRAARVPLAPSKTAGAPAPECSAWARALSEDSVGRSLGFATGGEWDDALEAWAPWKPDDLKAIEKCDESPCDVKINAAEGEQMGKVKPELRRKRYMQIVLDRVRGYQRTRVRKAYEFATPVEPWALFEAAGFVAPEGVKQSPRLGLELRRADFFAESGGKGTSASDAKVVHQVMDTRTAVTPDGRGAVLWRRDVYTDHYFDSWGEWARVDCDAAAVTVVQAVMLELDLLKSKNPLSMVLRGKMRSTAREGGELYLDKWYERLSKAAVVK